MTLASIHSSTDQYRYICIVKSNSYYIAEMMWSEIDCIISLHNFIFICNHIQILAKELWRLRVNFFVLLVLLFTSVGYVSPLASLHQFVTNPTLEEQNGTQKVRNQLLHTV